METTSRYKYDTAYCYKFQPLSSEIVAELSKSGVSAMCKEMDR
jgi:hypothetical protein